MIRFLAIIIGLFVATITTLALAPAISAIWSVPDQIAEQTNNKDFQSTSEQGLYIFGISLLVGVISIPLGIVDRGSRGVVTR